MAADVPDRIILSAFSMNCVSHIQQGLWVRDDSRQAEYMTLDPWIEAWAQMLDENLLDGEGPLFARFDTSELSRAALKDRGEFLSKMVQTGIYTRNDARQEEGKPPLEGLDEPLTPVNLMPEGEDDGDDTSTDAAED